MFNFDSIFFWPAVVLIGIFLIVLSFRFLIRIAILLVAVLVVWFCLSYVGLAPPPAQFFKKEKKKELESSTALLYQKQAGRGFTVKKLMKTDTPSRRR